MQKPCHNMASSIISKKGEKRTMKKSNNLLWGLISNPSIKNQVILSLLFCLLFSPVIWWICNIDFGPKPKPEPKSTPVVQWQIKRLEAYLTMGEHDIDPGWEPLGLTIDREGKRELWGKRKKS